MQRDAQDGISHQTVEGALDEILFMLLKMRELAVQAASDTLTSQDRAFIQREIDKLKEGIDNIAAAMQLNKRELLDADMAKEILEFTKLSILAQSGLAIAAQANQLPQAVLSLLK